MDVAAKIDLDAEEVVIVDTETLLLCRLCIEEKGKYQIRRLMQEQIKECFDIHIKMFDGLSQIICNKCHIIVGEIYKTRNLFKEKQAELLERRKNLILKESSNVSSTSIPNLSSSDISPAIIGDTIVITDQEPSKKSHHPLETKNTNAGSFIHEQEPSISSSDRVATPHISVQLVRRPSKDDQNVVAKTKPRPKPRSYPKPPQDCASQTVALTQARPPGIPDGPISVSISRISTTLISENKTFTRRSCAIPINYSEADNADSDEDFNVSRRKKTGERTVYKYYCSFCLKSCTTKKSLQRHQESEHPVLLELAQSLTSPCRIAMPRVSHPFETDASDEPWVCISGTNILKYSAEDPFQITKKCKVAILATNHKAHVPELETSEDDDSQISEMVSNENDVIEILLKNVTQKMRKKMTSDKMTISAGKSSVLKSIIRENETVLLSDSDSRSSFDMHSNQGESASVDGDVNKPKMEYALNEKEIYQIVLACWNAANIKKNLLTNSKKSWLVNEILCNDFVDVIWLPSKEVKLTKITPVEAKTLSKDIYASLPLYSSKSSTPVTGHIKLKQSAPVVPKIKITVPPKALSSKDEMRTGKRPPPKLIFAPPAKKSCTVLVDGKPVGIKIVSPESSKPVQQQKSTEPKIRDTVILSAMSLAPSNKINTPAVSDNSNTPIILSTVSLAKTEPSKTAVSERMDVNKLPVLSPPVPSKPMLKCKPTSLLLKSPAKNMFTNSANHVSADTMSGGTSLVNDQVNPLGFSDAGVVCPQVKSLNLMLDNTSAVPLPLLSRSCTVAEDMIMYVDPPPPIYMMPAINVQAPRPVFLDLVNTLARHDVHIITKEIDAQKRYSLVRYILTIRKCNILTDVNSEFLLDLATYKCGNLIFINLQNEESMPIDIYTWAPEFQLELIKSFKKEAFLKTMTDLAALTKENQIIKCVDRFINVMQNYPVDGDPN